MQPVAKSLKLLFLSAEVVPFAKRGGLGDVAGALPLALRALGHDVRVMMPAYGDMIGQADIEKMPFSLAVPVRHLALNAHVFRTTLPNSDVPVYLIGEPNLFGRRKDIYGYDDDVYRFSFFSRAAMELARGLDWQPDILHAHDWHTAPAILWAATSGKQLEFFQNLRTVFTIHNLAHQGHTSWDVANYLRVQTHKLEEESPGSINFMARGIYHADAVTTVSPTYAKEITTPEKGNGLDGLLRYRQNNLYGILNGIDYKVWDSATDSHFADHYDASHIEKRIATRHALQTKLGLPIEDKHPIVAMITRFDHQKGMEIAGHAIHRLMSYEAGEAQFVVLGMGAPEYENMFRQLARYHGDKMRAVLEFSPDLAPLIYGACDIFLMPSLFEPCGLGQMIAMRYGGLPVVRATGGLKDTVEDNVTGFVFEEYSAEAFWGALSRAVKTFYQKDQWQKMQQAAMSKRFSWEDSAEKYDAIYQQLAFLN